MPVVAVIVAAGVWFAGGVVSNDFRASMALTAIWFALAGTVCLLIGRRWRAHWIPDHVVDVHGLFRARLYGAELDRRIALYAPEAVLERIADLEDVDRAAAEDVFAWHPLPAGAYDIGPFRLESWLLSHYVPNAGIRLSTPESTVAYGRHGTRP